jgi:hypothetical protein
MRRCVISPQDASAHDNWTALGRTAEFDMPGGLVTVRCPRELDSLMMVALSQQEPLGGGYVHT